MAGMLPIVEVDRDAFTRMASAHFSELDPSFIPRDDWQEHYFSRILANPRYFLRWIVDEGSRAGFILFGLEDHRFLPRTTGIIYELYVLPSLRRRGLAKSTAQAAIAELWTHCPSKIQLEVMDGRTAAASFWRSLGFRKASERFVLTGSGA
jgi:ribosomal protein S18 acetylase RimI-like enzyme